MMSIFNLSTPFQHTDFNIIYQQILDKNLLIDKRILFCGTGKSLLITNHVLERLDERMGQYSMNILWNLLSASHRNVNRKMHNKKTKKGVIYGRNKKSYKTTFNDISCVWSKSTIDNFSVINKLYVFTGIIETLKNYNLDLNRSEDIVLLTMYHYDRWNNKNNPRSGK
jgi:hypothetical protein